MIQFLFAPIYNYLYVYKNKLCKSPGKLRYMSGRSAVCSCTRKINASAALLVRLVAGARPPYLIDTHVVKGSHGYRDNCEGSISVKLILYYKVLYKV